MTETESPPAKAVRRRAVRAAGPSKGGAAETTAVRVEKVADEAPRVRKSGRPPRRPAHRQLVAIVAVAVVLASTAALGSVVGLMMWQQHKAEQAQARNQRFIDTATQTLVNMYTFKPDNVEQSIDQFYAQISGNLRDEWARDNHIQNLKSFLRATGNSSEAVVNGAALDCLENGNIKNCIDPVNNDAVVLVSLRITQSDSNGNNKPSQPMRWRVTVHQDFDTGKMTTTDMKYPDGGS